MFFNGSWAGVCGTHWDIKEANVVCRQLEFQGAVAAATSSDFPGTKLMYGIQCAGNEMSLIQCRHEIFNGSYCLYKEACVVCISSTYSVEVKAVSCWSCFLKKLSSGTTATTTDSIVLRDNSVDFFPLSSINNGHTLSDNLFIRLNFKVMLHETICNDDF